MQTNALDVGGALKLAWDGFVKNVAALIVGAIIMGIVVCCSLCLLAGPMTVGYAKLCLKAARGENAEIGDVFSGFSVIVPSFLLFLIMGIAISIGFVLCVLPGLLLCFALAWAPFLMADGDTDPMSCLRRSWEFTRANFGAAIVFVLVAGIVGSVGSAIGGLGQIVTMPIGQMMMAYGFLSAFGGGRNDAPYV